MGIDIHIVDASADTLNKLHTLFRGHCSWVYLNGLALRINQTTPFSDTTTYANLSEDELATLEFLPDFDTRYTYLLSLSLGIDA